MTTYTQAEREELITALREEFTQGRHHHETISLLVRAANMLAAPSTSPVAEFVASDGLGTVRFLAHEGEPLTDGQQLFATPQAAPSTSPDAQDAARYRWLRSTTNFVTSSTGGRIDVRSFPLAWDEAIDAAIVKGGA